MLLPQHIDDVRHEQRQQIIDQYCNMNCYLCDMKFEDFYDADKHYRTMHNKSKGYLRCFNNKAKHSHFLSHIVWHLNPNIFKKGVVELKHRMLRSCLNYFISFSVHFGCEIYDLNITNMNTFIVNESRHKSRALK